MRGDSIAALIIVAITLFAGVGIGVMQQGLGIGDALNVFALLTVGDGLVSQIPALLISTATGIVITRSTKGGEVATQITTQLFGNPKVLPVRARCWSPWGWCRACRFCPSSWWVGVTVAVGYRQQQRAEQALVDAAAAPAPAAAALPSGRRKWCRWCSRTR